LASRLCTNNTQLLRQPYRITSTAGSRFGMSVKLPQPHLGDFLAHADDPFGPIQERVRVPALDRGVDVLKTVGAA